MPVTPSNTIHLTVPDATLQIRLDRWLAKQFPDHSRSEVQTWIRDGRVLSPQGNLRPGAQVIPGMSLAVEIPVVADLDNIIPEEMPLTVLYEDSDLVAIHKKSGQVVHPAPGHPDGTLLNGMLYRYPEMANAGEKHRPGLVHRLDAGTSGVILFARNTECLNSLQKAFKSRTVSKTYHCICNGIPEPYAGTIDAPIGRHPVHRKKRAVNGLSPRDALSHFKLLNGVAAGTGGLLEVKIETGRTHQIRVHLSYLGHPVIGDTLYGSKRTQLPSPWPHAERPMLHAREISLPHPYTGNLLKISAGYPEDMINFLNQL